MSVACSQCKFLRSKKNSQMNRGWYHGTMRSVSTYPVSPPGKKGDDKKHHHKHHRGAGVEDPAGRRVPGSERRPRRPSVTGQGPLDDDLQDAADPHQDDISSEWPDLTRPRQHQDDISSEWADLNGTDLT